MSGQAAARGEDAGLSAAANRRSAGAFEAAGRHSRRVRMLKLAIPAIALVAAGFFSAATFFRNDAPVAVSTDSVSMSDGRIVMANPKLDGMTGDKRPYKMQAERAYQEVKKDGLVELEKITAELPFGTDATAWLKAGGGFYSNSKSTLELSRDIVLTTSDGMQAKLKSARIDIGKNGLSTNEPVDITSKGSRITADSLQVSEGGKLLVFEKRVRLTIDPKNLDPQNSKSADGGGQVQQTE